MTDLIDFGIIPTTASLERLIELYGGQGLRIPPYQRGYEWNAKNIQRFVDTLFDEFKKSSGGVNPIFLGPIQISEEKGEAATTSIVDGRQRLTTLALLEAFLTHRHGNKNERSVCSLLCEQDDPQLYATVRTIEETQIEPYATISEHNPSVLRLTRKDKKASDKCEDIYLRNVRYIATILKNKEDETKGLLDYLKQNVFFIVVAVKDRDLTSIIKIFDSMNSTGQPLSDEAMFKLRLYAHVRSFNNELEPDEVMNHIKATYKLVDDYNRSHMMKIHMADVLWGFRLYCVASKDAIIHEKESADELKAETFLMPTLQFFEMLFSLSGVEVTLDYFRDYTQYHIRFYEQAYGDVSWKLDSSKAYYYSMLYCFGYTRYSSFWALPVICFALRKNIDVLHAFEECSPVFQACLAWSVCYDKANKKFRTKYLYDILDALFQGRSLRPVSENKIKEIDANRNFWDKVEKNIYDSYRQAYLLLSILGIQDEIEANNTYGYALSLYFMTSGEARPQIEHIYARNKWENLGDAERKSLLNGLGNLVPLEAKINKGDNKGDLPSIKFEGKQFFGKSDSIASVSVLRELYYSSSKANRNLDKPDVWTIEIVRPRFIAAKDRLINLMPLIKFDN